MAAVAWKNINALRGLAICLVVLHHATGTVFYLRQPAGDSSPLGPGEIAVQVICRGLSQVCVPAFLFASGFLLYRFCRSWRSAWGGIKPLAGRYALWSLCGYAAGLALGKVEPAEILPGFLSGGPFAAYWFLVLIVQLYLLSPWLARGVERRPRAMAALLLGLQAVSTALYYLDCAPAGLPAWAPGGHWFFFQAPFYILGMLFSARVSAVQEFLKKYRRGLALSCWLLAALVCAEGVLLGRLWGPREGFAFFTGGQSLAVILFSLAALLVAAGAETRPGRLRSWCDHLGARSLGILLTTDLCLQAFLRAVLRAAALLAPGAGVGTQLPPPWIEPYAVWMLPFFVLAGLLGPLFVMDLVARLCGRPVRTFLFG